MVDGAHAPNIPGLGVASLGADWYTGNFHKWCFAPKGCAFLWVAKPMQEVAQGVVISHQYLLLRSILLPRRRFGCDRAVLFPQRGETGRPIV
jgi:hypothetical protein